MKSAVANATSYPISLLLGVGLLLAPLFAQAQDDLPDLSDRTSQFLSGLPNDGQAKAVELGDFNGDGAEDLVISLRGAPPVLLLNESGVLVNRTDAFLPSSAQASNSNYAEAFDANGDGRTDVVFGRLGQTLRLYRNLGDDINGAWLGFDGGTDIAGASNILVVESGDLTGDEIPDLFVIQVENATNVLLVNDGSGNFTQASDQLGGLGNLRRGHAALIADVESDGDQDIVYIESDLFLYIYYNDGDGNFSDNRRSTFRNPDNFAYIFGAADFNGDGIFDYRQYSNPAPLAEISTGTFDSNGIPEYTVRQEPPMQRGNRKHGFVHIRDFDGDGDMDYVLSSILRNFGGLFNSTEGMRTEMVINQGVNSGEFVTFVAPDWANDESHDMKMIDINLDGKLDMFIAHQNRYAVYINNAPARTVEIDSVTLSPVVVGTPATLTVAIANAVDAQFNWDFGDGQSATTSQPEVTHSYAEPGRYQVVVSVETAQGSDQRVLTQRVHEPLQADPPTASMDIVYESRADGDRVYVVNPDNNSVSVLDAAAGTLLAEIAVGANPRSLALDNPGTLRVVNKDDATVSAIDTASLTVVQTFELPRASKPHGIVFDADRQFAYVALEALGQLLKIDFAAGQIVAQLDTGPNPRELGLSSDGATLYAPRFISLPTAGESTRNPAAGGGEILVVETAGMTLSATIELPYNEPANNLDTNIENRGIPNYLRAPALSPNGLHAIVPGKVDNIYRGSMRDGNAREHDMLVRGLLSRIDLGSDAEQLESRFHFDNNSHPTAVAFGPTGNYLFAVHEASRAFEVLDFYSNTIVASTEVGFAPQGLTVSADGSRVYVHNYLSRSVSVIDTAGLMNGTSNNADVIASVDTVSDEILPELVLRGKQLFHDSADLRLSAQKYISCASCHDDAGHDGRTWDFSDAGEGLRNTIDLRGRAGIGDGNVHWSANFDEFHDFENDIREIFDGTGLLSDADFSDAAAPLDSLNPKAGRSADLDALAAYGSTLNRHGESPYRNSDGSLTAAALRGREVFRTANCAQCHSGANFTDSPTAVGHNIGTVDDDTGGRLGQPLLDGGLDTPTLRGLWHGAPYLHDGAAATLQQAVLAHVDGVDFDASTLDSQSLDDLADYLLQIDDLEPAASASDDFDGDGVSDAIDPDDDNDGVVDGSDAFPLDPTESVDVDGDGIGDNSDIDLDNDGIPDVLETSADTDGDGVPNVGDLDSDNDGSADVVEAGGPDGDNDGVIDSPTINQGALTLPTDSNNDGIADFLDAGGLPQFSLPIADVDNDGWEDSVDGRIGSVFVDPVNPVNPVDPVDPVNPVDPAAPLADGSFNPSGGMQVDGNFDDWANLIAYPNDPDDVSGTQNPLDFATAAIAHDDNNFYIRYQNHAPDPVQLTWGMSVQLDTDANPATGFRGFAGELPIGVDYMIEGATMHRYTGSGNDFNWDEGVPVVAVINTAGLEMQVAREALGNPQAMRVFFYANNASVNGSALDFYPDAGANPNAAAPDRSFAYNPGTQSVSPNFDPPAPNPSATVVYNPVSSIAVDGDLSDWATLQSFGSDPDDARGTGNVIDWREGWMAHSDTEFFIGWQNDEAALLSWGNGIMLDTDQDISTGFRGFGSELPIGVDYLLEANVIHRYTGSGNDWQWADGGATNPVIVGNNIEIAIARAALGNPLAMHLFFSGNNEATGGTVVDFYPDAVASTLRPVVDRRFTYSTVAPDDSNQPVPPAVSLILDGELSDWAASAQLGDEDAADQSGANILDWRRVFADNDDRQLYLGYQGYQPLALSWGLGIYLDTDQNPATGFRGFANELAVGADYILEGDEVNRYTGATQNEWSWQAVQLTTPVIAGDSAEIAILLDTLGNPSAIDLVMRGDNSAIGGDSVDFHPDTGKFSYTLRVASDAPVVAAALPDAETQSAEGGGGGGTGAGLAWLCLLPLLSGVRRVKKRVKGQYMINNKCGLAGLIVASVLISACGGSGSGGATVQSGSNAPTVPNNNPSFTDTAEVSVANANPSFASALSAVQLDGTQSVPAVATRAQGSVTIQLNSLTGELSGTIRHSVENTIGATINLGAVGQSGPTVLTLENIAPNEFQVPAATILSATQIAAFSAGQLYIVVQSSSYPDGEIRGQLTPDIVDIPVQATLDVIQAKVFTPICSGCHTGGGSSLPGIMDLTTADSSFSSLINTLSLQEPDKDRVAANDADNSYLIHKLEGTQQVGSQMPFRGVPLDTSVVDVIRQWIDSGAFR